MNTGNLSRRPRALRAHSYAGLGGTLLASLLGAAACTAIFAPRDEVDRCGTVDDCSPTGDNRYVPECRYDEDNTEGDKICIATFKTVDCNPDAGGSPDGLLQTTFDMYSSISRYLCTDEQRGLQGCPPIPGEGCGAGLTIQNGICDDEDPNTPPVIPVTADLAGQDVKDQFCRSFFCDDSFVCDNDDNVCVRCDPDPERPYGQGGCGQLYAAGAPSCIYQTNDELQDSCPGADADYDNVVFGDCTAE